MIRQESISCAVLLPLSIYPLRQHKCYDTSLRPINAKIYREFSILRCIPMHIHRKISENVF